MTLTRGTTESRLEELEKTVATLQERVELIPTIQKDIKLTQTSISDLCVMVKELHANKTIVNRTEEGSSSGKQHASTNEIEVTPLATLSTLPRRLELPVFNGSDPIGWLARAEQYFEL